MFFSKGCYHGGNSIILKHFKLGGILILVLGRILLSSLFIVFGIYSIINWDVSYADLDAAMVNWQMYKANAEIVGVLLDSLISYLPFILGGGLFLMIVGGLLVFFGVKEKLGAFFLSIYIIFSTLLYFPFWFYEGDQMIHNLTLFFKNISILGGCAFLFKTRASNIVKFSTREDD